MLLVFFISDNIVILHQDKAENSLASSENYSVTHLLFICLFNCYLKRPVLVSHCEFQRVLPRMI